MGRQFTANISLAMLLLFLVGETTFLTTIEAGEQSGPGPTHTKTIVTGNLSIDRVYTSMIGPMDTAFFKFGDHPEGELLWLTGAKIETVDKQNKVIPDNYLCHTNLDVRPDKGAPHLHDHGSAGKLPNFMDLVQGQPEIEFPPGFAIPLMTDDWITFHAMALNSQPVAEPFDIRFKATFNYVYARDLAKPLKPLGMAFSNVFVPALHPNCPPPMMAQPAYECGVYRADASGEESNLHWLVPPGRHTYRHRLSEGLNIPFDTTAHFIAMHLHNFAESMALIDRTTNTTIFKGKVKYRRNKTDIDTFEYYSSEEGIALNVDHEYELITVYNNTTEEDIDAMAVLYIYYWDKGFDKNKKTK